MIIIVLLLLLFHVIPILITELTIYNLPLKHRHHLKRAIVIGTPINVVFNVIVFVASMSNFYTEGLFKAISNLVTLNCSYQDLARLASSCAVCIFVTSIASLLAYYILKVKNKATKKFRFIAPLILLYMISFVPIIIGYQISSSGVQNITINEICRKTSIISKDYYTYEDVEDRDASFVSITNNGELTFETNQLYLSDNEEDLQYLKVNGNGLKPGDTYKFMIHGDDGMNLKKKGGSVVYLSSIQGNIIDSVVVPALARDESYRKVNANEDSEWEIVSWSEEPEIVEVTPPFFSAESGFYANDFYLSLSSDEGLTVYYTLDCTTPTTDSVQYSQPIHVYDKSGEANVFRSIQNVQPDYKNIDAIGVEPVDKAFVVRAIAVDKDGNQSKTITKTFWINLDKYKSQTVISLVTDPDNLFDDATGIYVTGEEYDQWYEQYLSGDIVLEDDENIRSAGPQPNYKQRGAEWEREANCEILDNSDAVLNQAVGIRIQGNASRSNSHKRFSIYSRKEYSGSKWFDSYFPTYEKRTHSIVLRNGDRNFISRALTADRDVAVIVGQPVTTFVNGEYWYNKFYLFEKYSEAYFAETYQLNQDNITLINTTNWNNVDIEDKNKYNRIIDYLNRNDMTLSSSYYGLDEIIDIQSYIDYWCINMFLNNEDAGERLNVCLWRTEVKENNSFGDGRWRWGLNDMDLAWNFINRIHDEDIPAYEVNTFTLGDSRNENSTTNRYLQIQPIYKKLRTNDLFCKQFVISFMDIVNSNFNKDIVLPKLEEWGNKDTEITDFFTYRADYIVPYMAEEFELTGSRETVTLTSNRTGSPITLNTISPEINGSWSGNYFTDYPVTVTATDEGFDHWEITSNGTTAAYSDSTLEVPVAKGGVKINAIYK